MEVAEGFMFGDDVVLLSLDRGGVSEFGEALRRAVQHGSWLLEHSGFRHEFLISAGRSAVELDGCGAVWRFDQAMVCELVDALNALGEKDGPGHLYVDISEPADTLVVSRDEYV
ncbi:hypothetical protein [Mycobacterium sp. SMC-4]|uniref:hypothetical protein n=1 Tax=Mycobacterium sp. SMC-4 TaxID=2857059 RepID=UPI003CFF5EDE